VTHGDVTGTRRAAAPRGATRLVDAVVFDVGETLIDETRAWEAWADHLGIPRLTFMAVLGAFIARGGDHREPFELLRPGLDLGKEIEQLKAKGWQQPFTAADLYPDALDCLRRLAADGYRLGIAANQPADAAEVVRSFGIPLELVGMSATWDLHKPDPRFFERISRELALPPHRIAYVGDRIDNDVRPAHAIGMTAVFVRRGPWGWIQAGRGRPPEADLVVERLAELPDALRAIGERVRG
jgi:HAD superfamily hydrolase (TIGR01549 family)